ncbi:MAG: FliH/SctL family protein [Acidobacteria bacterium]|nr:FliH/SctL family protein [Acidobacteriota bacterium]
MLASGRGADSVGRSPSRVLPAYQAGKVNAIDWQYSSTPLAALAQDTAEFEQRVREAYDKGVTDGRQEARAAARAEFLDAIERLAQSAARLQEYRANIRRDAEQDLVKLSIAVARRLIRRELTVDPETVHGVIRVALEKMQARDISRLRVHPSQVAGVKEMLARMAGAKTLEVAGDSALDLGDAIFETSRSDLDATIDSQLREIERGFVDRLPK